MTSNPSLPRILVIDDLFGRTVAHAANAERRSLCAQYLLLDVTGDESSEGPALKVRQPIAEAVFCRGQVPASASVGDLVQNDLEGTLRMVAAGAGQLEQGHKPWSLILLDLCFYTGRVTAESNSDVPGMAEGARLDEDPASYFGLTLLSEIHARLPDVPVAILSNQPREEVSREFASRGALAFLPRTGETSLDTFRDVIWRYGLIGDPRGRIVGSSLPLLRVLRAARQAASSGRNILIRGERGCGKELLASYIHSESRSAGPYVVVDSGVLSPPLYASELFGHRRGAFTGADSARTGKIVLADGGDLFLDEIGNMPIDVQAGLLRVLDQREVTPLGATTGIRVDIRFLSATNENLESRSEGGLFRPDLIDRLCNGGTVTLVSLRDRREDIPELAARFLVDADAHIRPSRLHQIEPSALAALQDYDWPGNIRELQSVVNTAATRYADVEHLFPVHFEPFHKLASKPAPEPAPDWPRPLKPPARTSDKWRALEEAVAALQDEAPEVKDIGRLFAEVGQALARTHSRLLKAALEATRKRTPECPEGEIRIHPAVKLLMGTSDLSASKAADIIKRILTTNGTVQDGQKDPVLAEALQRAVRLRPGIPKKTSKVRKV
jgi:DNA-binding NtrC family response regulator